MSDLPDEKQLQVLLRDIDIPACPAILVELDAELRQEHPDQRVIARLISRDVALSGQVMQVVNSPVFSTGRQVDSIMQALTVLGFRQVFNMVVTQLLKRAFAGSHEATLNRFWDSSANTARVAAELARRLRCVKPDTAYTFGLFHDCGIPLLMKRFDIYREVLAEANAAVSDKFTAIEESRLDTSHAIVGYFLARRWKLPDFVVQGILLHHDYDVLEEGDGVPEETRHVIALSVLAEHITRRHAHFSAENEWGKAMPYVASFLGLVEEDLNDLIEDMLDWLESREQKS